jgi:hypothetical protein
MRERERERESTQAVPGDRGVAWPHVLADLEAKRQALDQMIGIVRTHFLPDGNGEMPASPIESVSSKTPKTRTLADVVDADADGILPALRKMGGEAKPGELAKAVGLSIHTLRSHLKPLIASKRVTVTGSTMSRRVALASAKEVP